MIATNITVGDIDANIESHKLRINPASIVSLIARTALECDDDSIPDGVLDDLVGRFRVKEGEMKE